MFDFIRELINSDSEYIHIMIKVFIIAVLFISMLLALKISNRFFKKIILRLESEGAAATHINLLKHTVSGAIIAVGMIAVIYQIDPLKSILLSLLAGSGIAAIIIGFASQQTIGNIFSGIMIYFYKPYQLGDVIRYVDKDISGIVEDISLRNTIIRTYENKRMIIPNSLINNQIIENSDYGDADVCNFLDLTLPFRTNIDQAISVITNEASHHPKLLDRRTDEEKEVNKPVVSVKVIKADDSGLQLRAWLWSKDVASGFSMKCDLLKSIHERFQKEGIEFAYPYRSVIIKTDNKGTGC